MSDNLFDRLFELFQTTDRVNWKLAEEITKSVAGAPEPIEPHLAEEYEELALAAHLRLAEAEFVDPGGGIIPHPIDRNGWAVQNHQAFAYLVEPLAEAIGGMGGVPASSMLAPLGPALLGMQAGTMAGYMSQTVLGQFDLALPPLDATRSYLVVPNVEAFATAAGLDPRQVRLWATLHELTYAAVVADRSLRDHIAGAVRRVVEGFDFDPSRLMERLNQIQDPSQLEGMFSDSDGLALLFGKDRDPALADDLVAAAAFVEGYGDYVVTRVGAQVLPDLEAITAAHRRRRAEPAAEHDQLGRVLGIEVTRSRANEAADFCGEIARRWGADALERVRATPANLPGVAELADPVGWAARVLLD